MWTRFPEQDLMPTCHELGITYVAYSPLGRGFLTGAIKSLDDLGEADRRRDHLAENIAAVVIVLDESEVAALDAAAPPDFTAGDRYPAGQMRVVNV